MRICSFFAILSLLAVSAQSVSQSIGFSVQFEPYMELTLNTCDCRLSATPVPVEMVDSMGVWGGRSSFTIGYRNLIAVGAQSSGTGVISASFSDPGGTCNPECDTISADFSSFTKGTTAVVGLSNVVLYNTDGPGFAVPAVTGIPISGNDTQAVILTYRSTDPNRHMHAAPSGVITLTLTAS